MKITVERVWWYGMAGITGMAAGVAFYWLIGKTSLTVFLLTLILFVIFSRERHYYVRLMVAVIALEGILYLPFTEVAGITSYLGQHRIEVVVLNICLVLVLISPLVSGLRTLRPYFIAAFFLVLAWLIYDGFQLKDRFADVKTLYTTWNIERAAKRNIEEFNTLQQQETTRKKAEDLQQQKKKEADAKLQAEERARREKEAERRIAQKATEYRSQHRHGFAKCSVEEISSEVKTIQPSDGSDTRPVTVDLEMDHVLEIEWMNGSDISWSCNWGSCGGMVGDPNKTSMWKKKKREIIEHDSYWWSKTQVVSFRCYHYTSTFRVRKYHYLCLKHYMERVKNELESN